MQPLNNVIFTSSIISAIILRPTKGAGKRKIKGKISTSKHRNDKDEGMIRKNVKTAIINMFNYLKKSVSNEETKKY